MHLNIHVLKISIVGLGMKIYIFTKVKMKGKV